MKKRIPLAAVAALFMAFALFIQVPAQAAASMAQGEPVAAEATEAADSEGTAPTDVPGESIPPEEEDEETPGKEPAEEEPGEEESPNENTVPDENQEENAPPFDEDDEGIETDAGQEDSIEPETPEPAAEEPDERNGEEAEAAPAIARASLSGIMPSSIIVGNQTIASLFPDTLLASYTAGLLGVGVNTPVTQNQLNSITVFNPTGAVHNAEGIQYLNGVREMRLDNLQLLERFPQSYLDDVHPNLNYYIANNQRYEHPLIPIYDKSLASIQPYIPPLFGQIAENSNGAVVGRWTVYNQFNGQVYSVAAVNGTELEEEIESLAPGRYTLELQLNGGVWMGLDNSLYYFPFEYVADVNGSISGRVTDASGGPLAGVAITLSNGASTTTDANGNYSFAALPANSYTVTASITGYTPQSKNATVVATQNTVVNFSLTPIWGAISGTVEDASTSAPIAGASVRLEDTSNGFAVVGTTTTDANGNYYFYNVSPSTYRAVASADGYNPNESQRIPVGGGATTVLDVFLNPIYSRVYGTVYSNGATQTPLANAQVTLPDGTVVTTLADGTYSTEQVFRNGSYVLYASADNHSTERGVAYIQNGDYPLDFYLTPNPAVYEVTVYFDTIGGTRAEDIPLIITYPDGNELTVYTDENGEYTLRLVAANYSSYSVRAEYEGYTADPAVITGTDLMPGDDVAFEIVLTRIQADITGTVYDADTGLILPGATVTLTQNGTQAAPPETADVNGNYTFSGVEFGSYTVTGSYPAHGNDAKAVTVSEPDEPIVQDLYLDPAPATLIIQAYYYNTDTPVPDAAIALSDGHTGITDASGRYTFALNPGTYTASLTYPDYSVDPQTAVLESGQTETLTFYLFAVPALQGGVIADTLGGNVPIAGATLTLYDPSGNVVATATTDEDGYYLMDDLNAGTGYTLRVEAEGYVPAARTVALYNGQVTLASFILQPDSGSIRGTVTYADGTPVQGVTIQLFNENNAVVNEAVTSETGQYVFFTTPGTYDVIETADGQDEPTYVAPLASVVVDFVIPVPPGTLLGTVTDENNAPVQGAKITAYAPGFPTLTTTANEFGYYTFFNVPPATYSVTASKAGEYASQTKSGTVTSDSPTRVDFTLMPLPGGIHGYVTHAATGEPIPGVTITELPDGLTVTTDADGYYSFVLTEGTYGLTAAHDGETQNRDDISVPDNTLVREDFVFGTAPGTLRGTATDQNGAPLSGVTITAGTGSARLVLTATTGADGGYSFDGIDPTAYTVNAALAGYTSDGPKTGEVPPLGTAIVDFTLTETRRPSLSGTAVPGGSTGSGSGTGSGSASGTNSTLGAAFAGVAPTADTSNTGLFLSLAALAAAGIGITVYRRKRERQ